LRREAGCGTSRGRARARGIDLRLSGCLYLRDELWVSSRVWKRTKPSAASVGLNVLFV
jgi:hypothetical protein